MGKLVQFDRRQRGTRPPKSKPSSAEILIFTGVRYERGGASEPDKPAATPNRPRRKRG